MKLEIKIKSRKAIAKTVLVLFLLLIMLSGCAPQETEIALNRDTSDNSGQPVQSETEKPASDDGQEQNTAVFVYVCGAVQNPGVYELPEGCRVYQAVEMAGGFTEDASLVSVNQAQLLEDGQQVRIPTQEEETAGGGSQDTAADQRININSADSAELTRLSGIGESRAMDIISYREQNGPFKSTEEIKNVSGIGDKTYEKIKENITVN